MASSSPETNVTYSRITGVSRVEKDPDNRPFDFYIVCEAGAADGSLDLSRCKDAERCEVRKCGMAKNLNGCYECEPLGCRKGLYANKIKARTFAEFARRYGMEELPDCLERNEKAGIVYHREGIMGDYDDFEDEEALIRFIRTGKR